MAREDTGTEQNGDPDRELSSVQPSAGAAATTGSVASEVIVNAGPENHPTIATEILRAEAGDVQATTVTLDHAGAEQVTAERIVMINSGARTVGARSAQVDRSGILVVRSDKAVFSNSTAIAIATEEARIVRSRVVMLKADRATIEAGAKVVIYAGPAGENMRPLADVRGAAAFGAGLGAVLLLLGPFLRRILRLR
ncbi:MAG TPA: hypothetical protein VHR64_09725 [Thermomicrobiales bacterium]|nr:hypothetical protein [Thermomicrobiales bacterium]